MEDSVEDQSDLPIGLRSFDRKTVFNLQLVCQQIIVSSSRGEATETPKQRTAQRGAFNKMVSQSKILTEEDGIYRLSALDTSHLGLTINMSTKGRAMYLEADGQ